jgi:hypothetical protein
MAKKRCIKEVDRQAADYESKSIDFTGKDLVLLLRSLAKPSAGYLDAVDDVLKHQPPAE